MRASSFLIAEIASFKSGKSSIVFFARGLMESGRGENSADPATGPIVAVGFRQVNTRPRGPHISLGHAIRNRAFLVARAVSCYAIAVLPDLKPGDKINWERDISAADILAFAEVSQDRGRHHQKPDADGRLMAHGLLTATMPTKIGGDLNYVARKMTFDFFKPVYSGDRLSCAGIVESVLRKEGRLKVDFRFEITNQHGVLVASGSSRGVIFDGH